MVTRSTRVTLTENVLVFQDYLSDLATEHGSSTSVFSLYWQLSQGRMADFPAFIASKSFDHNIPQIK